MSLSSPLINKNITKEQTHKYLFTSMVSHRGTPVSFAMREDGRIFYSVLDMSNTQQNANQVGDNDRNNDKNYWSKVNFEGLGASRLHFPTEIMQVGYGVAPNFQIDKYDSGNNKIIHSYDDDKKPLDANGSELTKQAIIDKTDYFWSSTARLGAKAPFQVISDGKYIYVFRQSIAGDDPNNATPAIVNNTLLVDRFILSGTVLKLSREIRYQRSRHKTEPESRKDTLSAVDVEGRPFYEPTRELVFANNLSKGNFSVLLLPGADSEEQRWQIFTTDAVTNKVNSFNIRFDYSIVFDTSDSQTVVNEFIEKYGLDNSLITKAQAEINKGNDDDDQIANTLLGESPYSGQQIPKDALAEVVYIIRTGVIKDDFIPASVSEWPLIEYESIPDGPVPDGPVPDGLILNLAGEGYETSGTWVDQSTKGWNGSPASNVPKPLQFEVPNYKGKSFKVVRFEPGQGLNLPDQVNLNSDYTIMIVDRYYGPVKGRTLQSRNHNWLCGKWHGHNGYHPRHWIGYEVAKEGVFYLNTAIRAGNNSKWFLDGIEKGQKDGGGPPQRLALCSAGRHYTEDSHADVAAILIWNRALTDAERKQAEGWLGIRYGIDDVPHSHIKAKYKNKDNGVLKPEYAFQAPTGELKPLLVPYKPANGLSSCYYYQQEIGADNKPMKNKACVMLAMGLEDKERNKYIGILNFSVAASGHLSRLTTDSVNMPDINVQALDENPYDTLDKIPTNDKNGVAWQQPQKMGLLDIDPNGLSTSGGVLKFAYTSADIGISAGYSDAVEATNPCLFDDSLGRVNLYFKGKNQNFFVLYFNPTGSKKEQVTDSSSQVKSPPLSLKPRLDRDMEINVVATLPNGSNTCTMTMRSKPGNEVVETWNHLPRRYSQISDILNGNGELPLGTLEPLGNAGDTRAAYLKPQTGNGPLNLRTTIDNNLLFQGQNTYGSYLGDGNSHSLSLGDLSAFLANNTGLSIAKKTFSVAGNVTLKADLFYKSYLSGMVTDPGDINKLWTYLTNQGLIKEVSGESDRANLRSVSMTGTSADLSTELADQEIDNLNLELLKEGNVGDKKARRARLKQSLIALIMDVAKVRIVTFIVQDTNAQSVDRLEAGLAVSVEYDYEAHFTCTPANLGGASAPKWEHSRSYLFNAEVKYDEKINSKTEIGSDFNYTYTINNTIGQWEDWDASLALEFNPASATNGALLNTSDSVKLEALLPTEKGLSVEAWVKPSININNPGNVLFFEKGDRNYSLGIVKDGADKYKCVANLGDKKYTSKNSFAFQNSAGKEQWRHLAFTHKKYWGYQLNNGNTINCGNDSSLQLTGDFTLEVLVKVDAAGTLLEKQDEYSLSINGNKEVVFNWAGTNCLSGNPIKLDSLGQFHKITLIRSRNKPQTEPTKVDYPITGGNQGGGTGSGSSGEKWYEGKSPGEITRGMAEKQDQMDSRMKVSQTNMLGNIADQSTEHNPKYYHTLIVTKSDKTSKEWTTSDSKEVGRIEAFKDFIMGGNGFSGTFASARIWNRALSMSEAKALTVPENKTGLLSHWRMAEGKGTYLYDDVSENHGIASEGKWTDSPQTDRAGQFQFYVDGSPEAHDTTAATAAVGVDQLSIGGINKGASGYAAHFKGTLEEIRIWNVPRTNEQITDNAFGRLKGEWEQLLANYTFDKSINQTNNKVQDASVNSVKLTVHQRNMLKEVLSTAPIATEIPQVRSALTGVLTDYNGKICSRPGVVEYGDVQKNEDSTLNGILKRCYSFIDASGAWNRMTGYKVGNLISQWYRQAQFAPQVMGYLEGPPPVPGENFSIEKDSDVDFIDTSGNAIGFNQAEEVSYNYSTSKEAGWNVAVESEGELGGSFGGDTEVMLVVAPLGIGKIIKVGDLSANMGFGVAYTSNWETSGNRSESYERGTSVSIDRAFSAALAGYDNKKPGADRYYRLGNTGYALVKSKTADIYLLRLAHNNALISISWQPNPDIPEDVNIIPFPINPLYIKQGTLDGKLGQTTDDHYPQAQGAYGQYSYFKPREAYKLKKQIEREKMELKAYYEDSFDVAKTNASFQAAAATTGVAQLTAAVPGGSLITSALNQTVGQIATQVGYNDTKLKEDLARMGSQRNLVNTYVWTVEGGFYAESTEVAATQQETYANETSLSLGGALGATFGLDIATSIGGTAVGFTMEQQTLLSSGSSFTLTKTRTKESSTSFGLEVSVDLPTSPRYKYGGVDGRTLTKGLIASGTVDAYRFMSFYLEPKGKNFIDLFSKVIDPIWLDESPDPNAQALRQSRGNIDKAKPCWRIMHRVTYVSRILPEFQPEAPPSLEKNMRATGIESNYMLIKKFEPYIANISDSGTFFAMIEQIIDTQMPEFAAYKQQIKHYLALYFNIDQA